MITYDQFVLEPTDIVVVPFYCEARFAPDFQAEGAAVLKRLTSGSTSEHFVPPFKSNDGDRDAWAAPAWGETDSAAARWLLDDLPPNQRRVVARLAAAGTTGVTTSELLAAGKYDPGTSASPVFKAISGRFRRVGRKPLWRGGEQTETGQLLSVPDGTARHLFVSILLDEYSDLAAEFDILGGQ